MVAFSCPESSIEWCRNLVAMLKDGGVWAIPRSMLVFRVDKQTQTLTLVSGDRDSPDVAATREAFGCIGWRVQS